MAHLTYTESKKIANKTIVILGIITIFEVLFALTGKGYLIEGLYFPHILVGGVMIFLSIVKAYLIIYEFMHMKYETKGLVRTVLFPTLLLLWAVIAFIWEGLYWNEQRSEYKVEIPAEKADHTDVHHMDDHNEGH